MRGISPARNDRCDGSCIDEVVLLDNEVRTLEEGGYGTTQKQRPHDAVEGEEELEGLSPKNVADLILELIAHSLEHECEEDDHPQPVGSAEARGVEQGEGGEERSSEGDEGGERKLPLTACGVVDEPASLFGIPEAAGYGVGSL